MDYLIPLEELRSHLESMPMLLDFKYIELDFACAIAYVETAEGNFIDQVLHWVNIIMREYVNPTNDSLFPLQLTYAFDNGHHYRYEVCKINCKDRVFVKPV